MQVLIDEALPLGDRGSSSSSSSNSRLLAAILASNIAVALLLLAGLLLLVAIWRRRRQQHLPKTLPPAAAPTGGPGNAAIPPYMPVFRSPHAQTPAAMPVHPPTPPAKADLAAPPGPHPPAPQPHGAALVTPHSSSPVQYYWQTSDASGALPREFIPPDASSDLAPEALFRVVPPSDPILPPQGTAEAPVDAPATSSSVSFCTNVHQSTPQNSYLREAASAAQLEPEGPVSSALEAGAACPQKVTGSTMELSMMPAGPVSSALAADAACAQKETGSSMDLSMMPPTSLAPQ